MAKILSDAEVFEQFSDDKSRQAYRRCWERFVAYNSEFDFEDGPPGEELLTAYFKYLRFEKKTKSSSVWTFYSYINSVMQVWVMEEDQEMLAMAGIKFKPQQQMDSLIVWEEDLELHAMAGLPNPAIPNQQAIIEASLKQAIAAIPNVKGTTINVVLVNGNNTMNF